MAQYVYGKNVVLQRLKEGKPIGKLLLSIRDERIEKMAKDKGIQVQRVDRHQLDNLVHGNHQGLVAMVEEYKTLSLEELLQRVPQGEIPLLVLLDELEDPHNLGAILRTCDAVKAHGVIIKKTNACPLNATVAKVSVGAIETVPVASVTNCTKALKTLKDKGYWVVGTAMEGQDYRSVDYKMPTVLVIGNEGKGISRLVLEECDFKVNLPMRGKIQSLNASVACGILLYEIAGQRFPL